MFIGHYSAAFVAAAHPKAPKLGTLFVAAQLVDFAFFLFVLGGIEKMRIKPGITASSPLDLFYMPYTHSLVGTLAWAALFALLLNPIHKNWTAALIGGAVVMSHWVFDVLVHTSDMSIAGGPPKFGLALWDHPMIEFPLEIGLVLGSAWFYARATMPNMGRFRRRLMVLIGVMLAVQMWNWFGPQPTILKPELPISALFAFVLFTALATWVARSRADRG
jgi:hypothetical protein